MTVRTRLFALMLALAAGVSVTPVLAQTPLPACQSPGGEGLAIAFPKGDASDVEIRRC